MGRVPAARRVLTSGVPSLARTTTSAGEAPTAARRRGPAARKSTTPTSAPTSSLRSDNTGTAIEIVGVASASSQRGGTTTAPVDSAVAGQVDGSSAADGVGALLATGRPLVSRSVSSSRGSSFFCTERRYIASSASPTRAAPGRGAPPLKPSTRIDAVDRVRKSCARSRTHCANSAPASLARARSS